MTSFLSADVRAESHRRDYPIELSCPMALLRVTPGGSVPVVQLRATQSPGPNPTVTVSQWLRVPCIHFLGSLLALCPFSLQVTNVDDEGVELGSGVMELTQSELVLHLHQRDAVRWPYLCLRRYGYDSNLFSFESGRRCQTGQGEYQLCPPGQGHELVTELERGLSHTDIRHQTWWCCSEQGKVQASLLFFLEPCGNIWCAIHEVASAPRPEAT